MTAEVHNFSLLSDDCMQAPYFVSIQKYVTAKLEILNFVKLMSFSLSVLIK